MRVRTFLVLLALAFFSLLAGEEVIAIVEPPEECATGGCKFTQGSNAPYICNLTTKTEGQVANDPSYNYPYGLIEFVLGGDGCPMTPNSVSTKIIPNASSLPANPYIEFCFLDAEDNPLDLTGLVYRKYGPTPDNHAPHWYDFMHDGQTGAEIVGNCVTLHFVDGGRGDDDLVVNDEIVDQGGFGRGNISVPTMTELGIMLFILFAGVGSVYFLRRQKRA